MSLDPLRVEVWIEGLGEPCKSQIAIPASLPIKGKTVIRTAAMTSRYLEYNTCNCSPVCLGCVIIHNYNPVALTANSRVLCVHNTA